VTGPSEWLHPLTGVRVASEAVPEGQSWNCSRCGRAIFSGARCFHLRPPHPIPGVLSQSPLRETRFHSRDCLVHHLETLARNTEEFRWDELAEWAVTRLPPDA
jgi:hypothetical protein